ncbi:hypothetical protein AVEN_217357-1 [Araneus ventricosus]|uniref:Uncharacterized protein n=1 Tax=Araneus ventricosus TaxID=182803 RepID=A0A4Y2S5E0_ARAVE|nr:hypothetical protein AVEN_217357-1 [Araneus ventricosus]
MNTKSELVVGVVFLLSSMMNRCIIRIKESQIVDASREKTASSSSISSENKLKDESEKAWRCAPKLPSSFQPKKKTVKMNERPYRRLHQSKHFFISPRIHPNSELHVG